MRIPVLTGLIRRRLLVNFRADPEAVQQLLPRPFRPKLQAGWSIAGICLIRLEQIRPRGIRCAVGIASENAAHRIAVEWEDATGRHEGVYIPRRDTGSRLNQFFGGRLFPGEHHPARFHVFDSGRDIDLRMTSYDGEASLRVRGRDAAELPAESCFKELKEASEFFEGGSTGFSPKVRSQGGLDALTLKTLDWSVKPLEVEEVESAWFSNERNFPKGSIEFDHCLIMRDIRHEWHSAEKGPAAPVACATC